MTVFIHADHGSINANKIVSIHGREKAKELSIYTGDESSMIITLTDVDRKDGKGKPLTVSPESEARELAEIIAYYTARGEARAISWSPLFGWVAAVIEDPMSHLDTLASVVLGTSGKPIEYSYGNLALTQAADGLPGVKVILNGTPNNPEGALRLSPQQAVDLATNLNAAAERAWRSANTPEGEK